MTFHVISQTASLGTSCTSHSEMRSTRAALVALGLLLALLTTLISAPAPANAAGPPPAGPMQQLQRDWADHPLWFDGLAEEARYDASRQIYGQARPYMARLFTNKEMADPETKTKSPTNQGRGVFKHHLREDVPTPNYAYHYSTMVYVGTSDLKSLKIDMGSQEDCGASFKQIVNHAGELTWHSFVYFPGAGHATGQYQPTDRLVFQNALSLTLRGYPFEQPRPIDIDLLPDQTVTRVTAMTPTPARITFGGKHTLQLPLGEMDAYRLDVTVAGDEEPRYRYWFAADGSAPLLHVMVQYEGPNGHRMQIREHRRWAYWELP